MNAARSGVAAWHDYMKSGGNAALLSAQLADDAVFHSPVVHSPQEGKAKVMLYLLSAAKVLGNESFTYVREMIDGVVSDRAAREESRSAAQALAEEVLDEKDLGKRIRVLERQMLEHARNLEFEKAARVRDQLAQLREQAFGASSADNVVVLPAGGAGNFGRRN